MTVDGQGNVRRGVPEVVRDGVGRRVGAGVGMRGMHTATGVGFGSTNQFGAVLTSGDKALRCDFMADSGEGTACAWTARTCLTIC